MEVRLDEQRARRLERELEEALARHQAILASTLDPIVTTDDRGVIQAVSDSIERVFGWRPKELVGRNVSMLMPEPHRSRHDGYLDRYRRTGRTEVLGRAREFVGVRKDGREIPIEVSVSRVDLPGQDRPLFTGIIRDITERQEADRAIRESQEQFRRILETVELIAVMLDTEGRITFCNDDLLRRTGRSRQEIIGRIWFDLFIPAEHRDAVVKIFRKGIMEGAIDSHFENEIVTRDGDRRLISWNNTILRDSRGVVTGVTGLGVDITERKRAEAELRRHREHLEELVAERTGELEASHEQLRLADRLASIGTLAAGLGHDMNNVLLPIRCRLDALDAANLPERARVHFDEVRKSAQYLQQLADGLHLLSLDPEDAEATTEGTDLSAWWDQVGPLLARGLPKDVRLATSWPSDLPPIAVAPHRLTQAVLNLVVNAGEAVGDNGKVRIWAEALEDGRFVRLGVSDNGHGMTADVKRRAIDPFFTTKKRGLGTGLGLSLVQGVAHAAGGSLQIDSEPGLGTTILLTLPRHRSPRGVPAGETPRLQAVVSVADRRLASFVSTLLGATGFTVVRDGETGPVDGDLWVTDATDAAMGSARTRAGKGRRILALGPAAREWRELGAVVVDDPEDFETLRERIHETVSFLTGGTS